MIDDPTIYYFLFGSFIFWSNFILCNSTLKKAVSKITIYIVIILFYIGVAALYYYTAFKTMSFIEYIIGFLPFIIIPLLYKDSVTKIVFTYFSGMLFSLMIHLVSNILTNHIFTSIQQLNVVANLTPELLFHVITLVFMLLYVLLIFVWLKNVFKKFLGNISNKTIMIACLLPVSAFVILLTDYILLGDLTNMNANVIAMLTLIVLILIMYIVMYIGFVQKGTLPVSSKAIKETKQVTKKEVISDPLDLLTSGRHYYELLLNTYMDMNNRTLDLDAHLQTMNSLLLHDNIAGATVFIERITQCFHDHELTAVSNNQSINLLLSYYSYLCNKEQIYLETHIDMPGNLAIPDLDLCIIFGNCIENAIEACRFIKNDKDRFINVDCKIQNGCMMIIVDNSFDGFINKINNELKSRKKFGGIGLKTIKAVVGKYRGTIDMEYPQNVFSIFIKLQLSSQAQQVPLSEQVSTAGKENRKSRRRSQ